MKILVSDKVSDEGVKILQLKHEVDVRHGLSPEELIAVIPQYDALVVRSETKVRRAVIEAATNLKVIGRAGVGVDNIDIQAATEKGIMVINAPDGNTIAAAELTMAMMLALARNVPQAHRSMKEGKWERSKFMGAEMRGKTLGIIGLGRIGTGVVQRALAFEMKVLAFDPFITEEKALDLGIELAELDQIYAQADFITLHTPLTPETKHIINDEAFAKMKKGMRIVQCARGGLIDEGALLKAIQAGIVAGAAVDVFEKEPVGPDNPLLGLENVIVTPHLGASTKEAQVGVAVDVAAGVLAALNGEPVSTAVNMPPVPQQVMKFIKPYFQLVEKIGTLAAYLAEGRIQTVEVEYNGAIGEVDSKMLTIATLKGVLNPILQEAVNYINAPTVAKSRGIKVREVKSEEAGLFANLISVHVRSDKGEYRVGGTLFAREGRIVMIDGYRVDVTPKGWLLIVPHNDHPGIIGAVGSLLGEKNINIMSMQVVKTEQTGKSIMYLEVESEISNDTMLKIKAVNGISGAKLVNFDGE